MHGQNHYKLKTVFAMFLFRDRPR